MMPMMWQSSMAATWQWITNRRGLMAWARLPIPSILAALRAGTVRVQQELVAAFAMQKKLVPIVWDMPPAEPSGWVGRHQAVNLAAAKLAHFEFTSAA